MTSNELKQGDKVVYSEHYLQTLGDRAQAALSWCAKVVYMPTKGQRFAEVEHAGQTAVVPLKNLAVVTPFGVRPIFSGGN